LIVTSNTVLFDDFLYNKKKSMKILLEFSGLFHCSVIKVLTLTRSFLPDDFFKSVSFISSVS